MTALGTKTICIALIAGLLLTACPVPAVAEISDSSSEGAAITVGCAGYAIFSGEGNDTRGFFKTKVIVAAAGFTVGWALMSQLKKEKPEAKKEVAFQRKTVLINPVINPIFKTYGISLGLQF